LWPERCQFMSLAENDRLRHMRDAARAASTFAAGKGRADLDNDLMFQFAIVRALEIIGEAAARLADATRETHPEIPWSHMIGMRNRLIHGYFDVDLDIVWRTVEVQLSPLADTLDAMIAATTRPPSGEDTQSIVDSK
jgi:uncharacterized protein with HEPN domain